MAFAQDLLALERLRFRNRLEVGLRLDPSLNEQLVPRRVIQPLIDNAFTHGLAHELRSGRIQEQVAASAEARRRRLATRRDILVGTNRYAQPAEPPRPTRQPDLEALQARRAAQTAATRTAWTSSELSRLSSSNGAAGLDATFWRVLA